MNWKEFVANNHRPTDVAATPKCNGMQLLALEVLLNENWELKE